MSRINSAQAAMNREEIIRVIVSLRRMRDGADESASMFERGMRAGYGLALRILWRDWDDARR